MHHDCCVIDGCAGLNCSVPESAPFTYNCGGGGRVAGGFFVIFLAGAEGSKGHESGEEENEMFFHVVGYV